MPRLATLVILLAAVFFFASEAEAGCKGPGGTCGLLGGSCCSGSSCIAAICVANCAGEGGVCVTSGGCCGSRVCALAQCRTPRSLGQSCGPGFPCGSSLVCDPFAGFVCVQQDVGPGGACGPLVHCRSDLVCDPIAGFRCVEQNADLGDACGPLVHCRSGLVCDPIAGFVCVDQTADLGDACGPLVQCSSGLVCDPIAGFVCVQQNAGPGDACGPLVSCADGLVCDPIAGFECVSRIASLGAACGPGVPCGANLVCDPLAGFVCVDSESGEGDACGPLVQCGEGLFCDPIAGFRCVSAAGVDEACGPGVPCSSGLSCTSAFKCAHSPALAGETCGLGFGCAAGLYCQAGLPSRCQALRKPGDGCSAFNPCDEGLSCEACFVNGCNAPFQCFQNRNQGAITEHQCRAFYSSGLHQAAKDVNLTMTYAAGDEIAALIGESQAFGVAYGADGRFGCFTSLCGGINADVGIEAFGSVGFYQDFDAVGGSSFANFQEAQVPGNLLNFSTSQVFLRNEGEILPQPELIGTEDALSIGIGPDILPFSAGSFLCETVLDTVIDPVMAPPPAPLAVATTVAANSSFTLDLAGWSCIGPGSCSWSDDDAAGSSGSGSGEVASPLFGAESTEARIESKCIGVMPAARYSISAWAKTFGALPGTLRADWRAGLNCEGNSVAMTTLASTLPDGQWRLVGGVSRVPNGVQSVKISLSAERDEITALGSTSRIDRLLVPEPIRELSGAFALLVLLTLHCHRRRSVGFK